MKGRFGLVVLFLLSISAYTQVIVERTNYNLGEVKSSDAKYFDFRFTNASNEEITITNVEEPYGTRVRLQQKNIKPDSSVLIRIKYTPKRKGEFSVDIPISVSSNYQPIVLTLSGKAVSFDANESMEPPPFQSAKTSEAPMTTLILKVIDKESRESISNASIDIIWDGVIYQTIRTNSSGMVKKKLETDSYYLIAGAQAYASEELDVELVGEEQQLTIELGKVGGELISEVVVDSLPKDTGQALQDEIPIEVTPVIEDTTKPYVAKVDPEDPPKDTTNVVSPPQPEPEITSSQLPESDYAANNIVFLIDISVSMRSQGKLDLLKASMIELASLLRPSDKLAIVTYSSQTNVVLHSTSASNKEEIIGVIKKLEAGGKTAGAKGVKKAYKVLNNNFIGDGNNQIFISTDGAFNLDKKDKKLLRIVKKNAKKGSKISVIGIKNKMWTVKNMEEIAQKGNGNYIHIENYETARSSLINEVKKQSSLK